MDPEAAAINKAISGGYGELMVLGVNENQFYRWRSVWKWLNEFHNKYGKTPESITLSETFPDFPLVDTPERVSHYVDQLVFYNNKKAYVAYVDKLNVALKNKDQELAATLTESLFSQVVYHTSERRDLVGSEQISDAHNFVRKEEQNFSNALTSGFSVIDEEIGGWRPGELIAFIAPTYSGKTYLLLQSAKEAVKTGHKILVLSCEMMPEIVWLRFLCLWFGLPVKRAMQGRLTDNEKKKLKRVIKEGNFPGDIVILRGHDLKGTQLVRRKILQYSPDAVYIDSWYGLAEGIHSNRQTWEQLSSLAADFKRLAIDMGIPIVLTHQMGRAGAERTKGARLTDVAGSFDLIGWLDVAAVPVLNDDLRRTRELGIIVRKARNFDPFSFTVKFNVNDGEPIETQREMWVVEDAQKGSTVGLSDEDLDMITKSSMM